jgi:hypothetical protein
MKEARPIRPLEESGVGHIRKPDSSVQEGDAARLAASLFLQRNTGDGRRAQGVAPVGLLALQSTAGNRAVGLLLQRQHHLGSHPMNPPKPPGKLELLEQEASSSRSS